MADSGFWPATVPAHVVREGHEREPRAVVWPPVITAGEQLVTFDADGDYIGGVAGEVRLLGVAPLGSWAAAIDYALDPENWS